MKYRIELSCIEDTTQFDFELTPDQLDLVKKLCVESQKASTQYSADMYVYDLWPGDVPCPLCGSKKGEKCDHDF